MNVSKRSLIFDHVITYETFQQKADWQEGISQLEDFPLNYEIYQNGPIFFSFQPEAQHSDKGTFTYYMPINEAVGITDGPDYGYLERFQVEDALVLRQADEEADFQAALQKVQAYAAEQQLQLEDTFYCVVLFVYGEPIIDLYVPLKERGGAS